MKRVLLAILLLFILMGCTKQPETNTADPQYPFVDEDGKLNVDVSWHEFE